MEGGERGIRSRDDDAVNKLRVLAKSDFKHDFGEGVDSRDKFVGADLARFEEIAQRYGIGKVKALKEGFNRVVGSNPYTILKDSIPAEIYPDAGTASDYLDESAAMSQIGLDYDGPAGLKQQLKDLKKAAELGREDMKTAIFRPPPLTIRAPGNVTRSYEVSAVLVKDKSGEGTLNIASRFERVTGGKTKFAMVIDASGGLSMTSVQNSDLEPLPTAKCDFYILENIENDSDSATKLKHIDVPKNAKNLAFKPDLHFLKDAVDTVVYPSFKSPAELDGEALFGNANLVLSRVGDDTEADFTFANGTTYHIDNVSQNANVKNASLNILAARLANPTSKQPYLYPYIKRVGDWCQALSLLDTSRPYRPVGEGSPSPSPPSPPPGVGVGEDDGDVELTGGADPITLESLRKEGVVIAALTLDRILLAYLLSLGIDVFFTTATDLRMLVYFRNMESAMSDEELRAANAASAAEFDRLYGDIPKEDIVPSILNLAVTSVMSQPTDITYIAALRSVLYRISVLRTSYSDLRDRLTKHEAELAAVKDVNPKEYNRLLFDGILIIKKILNDHKHNATQASSLATYPNFVNDKQVYELMASDRPSRNAIAKLKIIVSKDMHDDIVQCKKIFAMYRMEIRQMFRSAPIDSNKFAQIWAAFGPEFQGVQTGGGKVDIDRALNGLLQFEVTPVTGDEYKADSEALTEAILEKPTYAILGSYYRDEKGFPYSVVDAYLITKETLSTFETLFKHLSETPRPEITPDAMFFVMRRYLLLWCDLLQAEYEKLIMNGDDEVNEETGAIAESDVKFSDHKRIYYQAAKLLQFVTTPYTAYDRFVAAHSERAKVNLKDNATIDAEAVGRLGLRKNNYGVTRDKIQTVRAAIYGDTLFRVTSFPTGGGGLQARRSLYKKHVEAPRMGGRRGLYEGLRQRTGTGATARVRQLPIVSRTRRQRKHVGRV
jgi:hypothetical protein